METARHRGLARGGQSFEEAAKIRRDALLERANAAKREGAERQRLEDEFRDRSRVYKEKIVAWAGELAARLDGSRLPPDRRIFRRNEREETVRGFFRDRTRTVSGPIEYCDGWLLTEQQWVKEVYVNPDLSRILDQGRSGSLVGRNGQLLSFTISTQHATGPVWVGKPIAEQLPGDWAPIDFEEDLKPLGPNNMKEEWLHSIWRIRAPLSREGVSMYMLEPALSDLAIRMDVL